MRSPPLALPAPSTSNRILMRRYVWLRLSPGVEGAAVLVTGSMYLAGQVRRRWFPDQDIVLQRTPWPTRDPKSDG